MFKAQLSRKRRVLSAAFSFFWSEHKNKTSYSQNINVSLYLLIAISAFCLATSAAFWAALTAASTLSRIFPDLKAKILDELRVPVDDATSMLFLYLPSILIPATASSSPVFHSSMLYSVCNGIELGSGYQVRSQPQLIFSGRAGG